MAQCRYRQLLQGSGLFVYVFLLSCILVNFSNAENQIDDEDFKDKEDDVKYILNGLLEKTNTGETGDDLLGEEGKRQFLSSSFGKRQFLSGGYFKRPDSDYNTRDSNGQFYSGKRNPQFFHGKRDPQFFHGKRADEADEKRAAQFFHGKRDPQFFHGK
ncbi:uncharacterized protein LOC144436805 [Glandiceps talaboti]